MHPHMNDIHIDPEVMKRKLHLETVMKALEKMGYEHVIIVVSIIGEEEMNICAELHGSAIAHYLMLQHQIEHLKAKFPQIPFDSIPLLPEADRLVDVSEDIQEKP